MADIVSAKDKMTDVEISHNQPHSEDLMTKFGANINYLIDKEEEYDGRLDAYDSSFGSAGNSATSYGSFANSTEFTLISQAITVPSGSRVLVRLTPYFTGSRFSAPAALSGTSNPIISASDPSFIGTVTARFKRGSTTLVSEVVSATTTFISSSWEYMDESPGSGSVTYSFTLQWSTAGSGPSYNFCGTLRALVLP